MAKNLAESGLIGFRVAAIFLDTLDGMTFLFRREKIRFVWEIDEAEDGEDSERDGDDALGAGE